MLLFSGITVLGSLANTMASCHPDGVPYVLLLPMLSEGAGKEENRVMSTMDDGHTSNPCMVSGNDISGFICRYCNDRVIRLAEDLHRFGRKVQVR